MMIEKMVRGPVLGGSLASPEEEVQRWGGGAVYDIVLTLADREGQYRRFKAHKRVNGDYVYNIVTDEKELR